MSVLICKEESVSILADFIVRLLNHGLESYGFSCPQTLGDYFRFKRSSFSEYNEKMVYDELFQLNIKAYSERYKELDLENIEVYYPEFKSVSLWKPLEYVADANGRAKIVVPTTYYRLRKHLMFWLYQCEEDGTKDSDLYKGMKELCERLTAFIVENTEAYYNLPWE